MLILTRKKFQSIRINENIEVTILDIDKGSVKISINRIMETQLVDNQKARIQDSNGKYHYKENHNSDERINSQEMFLIESLGTIVEE